MNDGKSPQTNGLRITLMLTGSIAAFKACALVSLLVKDGHEVQTLATPGALRFVGQASLEGLSGRPVFTDLWAPGETMSHIELRRWSDLFIVYPATANRINAMASGLADDLFGAVFLANNFERPFWIAPAMNTGMLEHPATRASLAKLGEWGCRIVGSGSGTLACGDIGAGRLAEPEDLAGMVRAERARIAKERFAAARSARGGVAPGSNIRGSDIQGTDARGADTRGAGFSEKAPAGGAVRRALVTGGGMDVPLDAVRSIRNTSTGATSAAIVSELLREGWEVDFLHHAEAVLAQTEGANLVSYRSFPEFDTAIRRLTSAHAYEAIVQAAAVSDYRLAAASTAPTSGAERATDTAQVADSLRATEKLREIDGSTVGRSADTQPDGASNKRASTEAAPMADSLRAADTQPVGRAASGTAPAANTATADAPTGKWRTGAQLSLHLEPNPKLLPQLRAMALGRPKVVGFKLTVGADEAEGEAAARPALDSGQVDAVLWNDLETLRDGKHPFVLFRHGAPIRGRTKAELARAIVSFLSESRANRPEASGAARTNRPEASGAAQSHKNHPKKGSKQ